MLVQFKPCICGLQSGTLKQPCFDIEKDKNLVDIYIYAAYNNDPSIYERADLLFAYITK